jgi:hypothetical protein
MSFLKTSVFWVFLFASPTAWAQNATQDFKKVEADNGSAYAIDLNSIAKRGRETVAIICPVEAGVCVPRNMFRVAFDCKGHYVDIDHGGGPTAAPPHSLIGRMADIACAKTSSRLNKEETPSAVTIYHASYVLAGFLLRAARACELDKGAIELAFSVISSDEMKAFTKAYPTTSAAWMGEGSDNFNKATMKAGLKSECNFARDILKKTADSIPTHPR